MADSIGWIATAIFSLPYLSREPGRLRLIQAMAACLWIAYGLYINALPVVVANVAVAGAALFSMARQRNKAVITAFTGDKQHE